jgi:hypothetical protein
MKYLIILLVLCLTGCSTTVPVTAKFPEAPNTIQQQCPALQKLKDDAKLSEVATTVTLNYSTYYECSVKVDGWIEWYQVQKQIFESIK